jgi:hypothetical protein
MRPLTRGEWEWIIAGAVPVLAGAIYFLVAGLVGPATYLLLAFGVVFYVMVWWVSTRGVGRLRVRLSVPCFAVGFISFVVIPSLQPITILLVIELVGASLTGSAGIVIIANYDFSRIKIGRKTSPTLSRLSSMMIFGIFLMAAGWFTVLGVGYFSTSFLDTYEGSSPAILLGKICWIVGVTLVGIAVVLARRNYL